MGLPLISCWMVTVASARSSPCSMRVRGIFMFVNQLNGSARSIRGLACNSILMSRQIATLDKRKMCFITVLFFFIFLAFFRFLGFILLPFFRLLGSSAGSIYRAISSIRISLRVLCSSVICWYRCQNACISGVAPRRNSSEPCRSIRSITMPTVILWVSSAGW